MGQRHQQVNKTAHLDTFKGIIFTYVLQSQNFFMYIFSLEGMMKPKPSSKALVSAMVCASSRCCRCSIRFSAKSNPDLPRCCEVRSQNISKQVTHAYLERKPAQCTIVHPGLALKLACRKTFLLPRSDSRKSVSRCDGRRGSSVSMDGFLAGAAENGSKQPVMSAQTKSTKSSV